MHPDDDIEEAVGANHSGIVIPVVEDGVYLGAVGPGDAPAAQELVTVLGPAAAHVDTTIAPRDRMYGRLRGPYLLAGHLRARLIRVAMAQAGMQRRPGGDPRPACGHGRVMRVLRAAFPAATLIACDIDRDGVDFCAQTFGAVPVYSDVDPANVRIEQQVDLIWVGSLFTHVDPASWTASSACSRACCVPGGVLVSPRSTAPACRTWGR